MAVFLLSPSQSGHTTAKIIVVDGGYTHLDRALTLSTPAPSPSESNPRRAARDHSAALPSPQRTTVAC